MTRPVQRTLALPALLILGILVAAGCGGEDSAQPDRFSDVPKRTIEAPDDQTAPRWQQIALLRGADAATRRVVVSPRAIQWRLRWSCRGRRIALKVTPPPAGSDGRAASRCPGSATWVGTGPHTVDVRAAAGFRVIVEEELRTPLREPASAAVRSGHAREIARGRFSPIEAAGRGTAVLHRLPGGRFILRLEGFATEPNPDLDVWLSTAARPTTTKRAFAAAHVSVRSLKATIGDQNYLLPASTRARAVRSVVIVNATQRIAYAAAELVR